ncbi:DNA primase [Bacillaceae bacterium SIJ1]|uniref:DNA primase n=1 Tax=Litoribacterium kuwaitense TaxID=1398745 RepID=UPI0013ED3B3B|nr:DNA primase [Litoribacterium kuwaitense]NGP43532.1 DNA primase [Litoribacterium kuwaitense]
MSQRIPEETVEAIRQSVDIVDVIGEYVQLKKQGKNHFGLCPFHGENTPSFSVSEDKQIFHCFGCGVGGNAFQFLMDYKGISFVEAVQSLATQTNVALPDASHVPTSRQSPEQQAVKEAYELVTKLYHHLLMNTEEGAIAREYVQQRDIHLETANLFRLGYAPDSWQLTVQFLEKRGYDLALMHKAGLIGFSEHKERYYDKYRNRLIFPIADTNGTIIAFGGRAIAQEMEPKFLNTAETPWFEKGKNLYSFTLARPAVQKEKALLLMEGNIDVVTAHQAGFTNAIATLGTALTKHQALLIKRAASKVTLCYDRDDAGCKAAIRAASLLEEMGVEVRIAELPEGTDPDDCIRKKGASYFQHDVLGNTKTLMAFKMQLARRGKNLRDEGERLHYIETILKDLLKLHSEIEKEHYLTQLSEEFSISVDVLRKEMNRLRKDKLETDVFPEEPALQRHVTPKKTTLRSAFENAERLLLTHMLKDANNAASVYEKIGVSFYVEAHQAIATHLYAYYEEYDTMDIPQFIARLNDARLESLVSELALTGRQEALSEKELSDCIQQVLNYPEWLMIRKKEKQKEEAEKRNDFKMAAQIGQDIILQKRKLKSLRSV